MAKRTVCLLMAGFLMWMALSLPTQASGDEAEAASETEEAAAKEYVGLTLELMKTPVSSKSGPEAVPWDPEALEGKTISILGDSISTFRNYSNRQGSRWSNTTIGKNRSYKAYSDLKVKMEVEDTWWHQLAEDMGLRVLVNNSWSGSTFFMPRVNTQGAYKDRCVQLHDNTGINDGAEPDIIVIFLGTNDFKHFPDSLGTADIDYDSLRVEGEDGRAVYREPTTTMEAAAICLSRIRERYPLAEVYLMELLKRGDMKESAMDGIKSFNGELSRLAEHYGAFVIPTFDGPITAETFGTYYIDGKLHPSKFGMDVLTEAAKKAILEHTAWKTGTYYPVTYELNGVKGGYGTQRLVRENAALTEKFTVDKGKKLTVTVTMGGQDVTAEVVSKGVVSIPAVTGEVTITASAA